MFTDCPLKAPPPIFMRYCPLASALNDALPPATTAVYVSPLAVESMFSFCPSAVSLLFEDTVKSAAAYPSWFTSIVVVTISLSVMRYFAFTPKVWVPVATSSILYVYPSVVAISASSIYTSKRSLGLAGENAAISEVALCALAASCFAAAGWAV